MTHEQLKIRLPRALKGKVHGAAKAQGRTMNAEIVARLERTFIEDSERIGAGKEVSPKTYSQIAEITKRLGDMDALESRLEFVESRLAKLEGKPQKR